jgi:hypothetical protein
MSMFTDYWDSLTDKEKEDIRNSNKKNIEERIYNLKNKISKQQITIDDFKEIVTHWNTVAQMNPQWTWPKEKPVYVLKICEEINMCMSKDNPDIIFDLYNNDDLSDEQFYNTLYDIYLNK